MATIHLIEGPVGAGKSTYAGQLGLRLKCAHLNLDEWMVTLFSPDRPKDNFMPWYEECKARCIEQIWLVALELLHQNNDVILELGLVQKPAREAFYSRVAGTDFDLQVHWLDTPEHVRWERVQQRNQQSAADARSTLKMQVSEEIFKLANSAWQAPDDAECEQYNISVVS